MRRKGGGYRIPKSRRRPRSQPWNQGGRRPLRGRKGRR